MPPHAADIYTGTTQTHYIYVLLQMEEKVPEGQIVPKSNIYMNVYTHDARILLSTCCKHSSLLTYIMWYTMSKLDILLWIHRWLAAGPIRMHVYIHLELWPHKKRTKEKTINTVLIENYELDLREYCRECALGWHGGIYCKRISWMIYCWCYAYLSVLSSSCYCQ